MLDTLGNLGDFFGGIGVVVSLVYLATQIRQNTKSTKAATYQAIVTANSDWSREMSLNAEISRILNAGMKDLDALPEVERIRFNFAITSIFRNFENVHYQYVNGSIEEAMWAPWAIRIRGVLLADGAWAWWSRNRAAFSADFQEFTSVRGTPNPSHENPMLPNRPGDA